MSSLGSFYLLTRQHEDYGRTFVRLGVIAGAIASALMLYPTGDGQGRDVIFEAPATLAAMEGLFTSERGAPLALVGQPDVVEDSSTIR